MQSNAVKIRPEPDRFNPVIPLAYFYFFFCVVSTFSI